MIFIINISESETNFTDPKATFIPLMPVGFN